MTRLFFFICFLSINLFAENNEKALKDSLLKFWEARNTRDFETIYFYESKIGAITGSSSENHFYEDPPPDFESVINYYSRVESDVTPSNIRIIQLAEKVYLTLYYLSGGYVLPVPDFLFESVFNAISHSFIKLSIRFI